MKRNFLALKFVQNQLYNKFRFNSNHKLRLINQHSGGISFNINKKTTGPEFPDRLS